MGRSGIVLALVLIGCIFSISIAIEEDTLVTVGIDFGTNTSCVGVYKNGHVEIIPNDQGNRTTPSWVAFTDSERPLIGEVAKNQAAANPQRTILRDYFDGKEPKKSVKPDEAVAIGAAVLGDALTEEWWDLMC